MVELDKSFVVKNKRALLEEISMQLSKSRDLIDIASTNPEAVAGAFIGLAASVGAIDGYFRQYMLLRRGEFPVQQLIGFQAFNEEPEEEEPVDEEEEEEVPNTQGKNTK